MPQRLVAQVALGLACVGAGTEGNFVPFSNVEELKPRRIHDFCSSEQLPGQDPAIRRCEHYFKKTLEDESDVELGWKMEVDPDSILSLDTEAEHGVRLTRCGPAELELELPESHVRHAAEGKFVVGSRFVHNCAHRPDHQLYHRIREVRQHQWVQGEGSRVARVHVLTEELENIAHVMPKFSFHFAWTPSEAKSSEEYPEMKTDYGLNRPYLDAKREGKDLPEAEARRLFGFPSLHMPKMPDGIEGVDGVNTDDGGFASGGKTSGDFDTKNGVINLMPKQLSNFGWNWNFFMNTTQEPTFNLNAPGLVGRMKVRQPYIKVHAGIYLNFSSEFGEFLKAPRVNWRFGVKGQGHVQARVLGSMNTTDDTGADAFSAFKLPILKELENPLWFEKVDFATGSLPISMEPGFQCSATMYHHGRFKGALGVGGRTRGWLEPVLVYDSLRGFDTLFNGQLEDTDLWPPMWLMFTRHFEIGLLLKPSLLMRGDFAGLERATMAIESRPFANVTIKRLGTDMGGGDAGGSAAELKKLTVYPIRVMGISEVDFNVKYQVKISVNGQDVESSPQVNWGMVEFKDHISNFECGVIPESALMNTSKTRINVTLVKVSDNGAPSQTVIGSGEATCPSIVNGECQPSPAHVSIQNADGLPLVVQLAILWQNDPAPWFSSKLRGFSFSFPQVILRQDTLAAAFPDSEQPTPGSNASQVSLHIVRGGQTYNVGLVGTIGSQQSALAGDTMVEFPPSFIDSWKPCPSSEKNCISPRLELYAGNTKVATADMPLIDLTSSTSMQGTTSGSFLGGGSKEMNVPSTIALSAPGSSGVTIALATMEAKADPTLASSIFLMPRSQIAVKPGATQKLQWTICDVVRTKEYEFSLLALRLTPVSPSNLEAYSAFRMVNNNILQSVTQSKQTFKGKCTPLENMGMSAASAPCAFDFDFVFGSGFSSGDQLVIEISWNSDGLNHEMFSPPIEVSEIARRLSGDKPKVADFTPVAVAAPLDVEATPRRLWSQEAWNARIQQHASGCNRRDLHFDFGLGMLMRGKIDSIDVPKGFPMIGGTNEEPQLTTGFRKFDLMKPGEDAEDALGGKDGVLCQMGLCRGYLPGCAEANSKQMHFPKIVFDFNRQFHFGNKTHPGQFSGLMQQAMAYAFSTLPEMVDVVIQQFNKTGKPEQTTTQKPTDWWKSQPSPTPAPSMEWPTQSSSSSGPSPSPAPKEDSALKTAFNKWWSGATGRRLDQGGARSSLLVGDSDELPSELAGHQVRLDFKQGVPFVIDRPLVELMMQHGYFFGIEDVKDEAHEEQGPLAITRFYIDSGIPDDVDGADQTSVFEQASPASSGAAFAWTAMVASAAVLGFASVLVLRVKRGASASSDSFGYISSEEAEGME